jgi:hypothetical protein
VGLPLSLLPFNPISRHRDSIPIPPKDESEDAGSVTTCVSNKENSFGLVHRQQTAKVQDLEL